DRLAQLRQPPVGCLAAMTRGAVEPIERSGDLENPAPRLQEVTIEHRGHVAHMGHGHRSPPLARGISPDEFAVRLPVVVPRSSHNGRRDANRYTRSASSAAGVAIQIPGVGRLLGSPGWFWYRGRLSGFRVGNRSRGRARDAYHLAGADHERPLVAQRL